jgi:hypothetical protein
MGGDGSGRKPDIVKSMIRQMQPPVCPDVSPNLILPNHSGMHDAGILVKVPVKDIDLVNKKYVDDEIAAIPTPDLSAYAKLDGSNQPFTGIIYNYNPNIPDIGLEQTSDLRGYDLDYVSDKALVHCSFGSNDTTIEGGFRYEDGFIQVYRSGTWDTLLAGVELVTDETETSLDVELTNFDYTLSIITGDSDELDFNGEPLVQQMFVPMGCYASRQYLNGGTF